MSNPIQAKAKISNEKVTEIIRLESDTFEICQSKVIRIKAHLKLIGEKTTVVHRRPDGKLTVDILQ